MMDAPAVGIATDLSPPSSYEGGNVSGCPGHSCVYLFIACPQLQTVCQTLCGHSSCSLTLLHCVGVLVHIVCRVPTVCGPRLSSGQHFMCSVTTFDTCTGSLRSFWLPKWQTANRQKPFVTSVPGVNTGVFGTYTHRYPKYWSCLTNIIGTFCMWHWRCFSEVSMTYPMYSLKNNFLYSV